MLRFTIILVLAVLLASIIFNIPSEPVLPVVQRILSLVIHRIIVVNPYTVKEVRVVTAPTTIPATIVTSNTIREDIIAIVNDTSVEYLRLISLSIYTGKYWTISNPRITRLDKVGSHYTIPCISILLIGNVIPVLNGYNTLPVPQYTTYNELILRNSLIIAGGETYYYDKANHILLSKQSKTKVYVVKNLTSITYSPKNNIQLHYYTL